MKLSQISPQGLTDTQLRAMPLITNSPDSVSAIEKHKKEAHEDQLSLKATVLQAPFPANSGVLDPVTNLSNTPKQLSSQPCKRMILQSTNSTSYWQDNREFKMTTGVPYYLEGISNTNQISVSGTGTVYVRWEAT